MSTTTSPTITSAAARTTVPCLGCRKPNAVKKDSLIKDPAQLCFTCNTAGKVPCAKCGKLKRDDNFETCYSCNQKALSAKCVKCKTPKKADAYDECWKCKTANYTACVSCDEKAIAPGSKFKECYKCSQIQ